MPPTEQIGSPGLWAGFLAFVVAMLALDLGVFHRKAHVVGVREALVWSIVWVALASVFGAGVWAMHGPERGLEYFTGYLIEKSLSIDNVFVFVVIFASLGIPAIQQHRVLFWGILSALVLRAAMIFAGSALLQRFHWLIYVFGAFLVLTGVKLFLQRNQADSPADSSAMRALRRLIPSTDRLDGANFFTRVDGRRVATPLFLALALVEFSDVIFAVDSIPAIFAVTSDPFIVFTSNIFAILGLRSLYFLLADLAGRFRHLKVGLAFVLVFVGVKMSAIDFVKVPPLVSLGVISAILGVAVAASMMRPQQAAGGVTRGLGAPGVPPTAP